MAEFGKEKMVPLKGLDDKAIENKVTELVKASI
jgi:NADH dehydrogenase (ubiquinone) 1 alpha subcomplex subunit 2